MKERLIIAQNPPCRLRIPDNGRAGTMRRRKPRQGLEKLGVRRFVNGCFPPIPDIGRLREATSRLEEEDALLGGS